MATLLELAKDAFKNHNYILSCEIFERLLRESGTRKTTELYFGYGDSLAKCSRIKEALDIYAHICYQLCEIIPVEKLKFLASSIIEFIVNKRTNPTNNHNISDSSEKSVDPLLCPVCEEILKYPVTSLCGHSYCRECCFGRTNCVVCGQKFPILINNTMFDLQKPSSSTSTPSSAQTMIGKNATITSDISLINTGLENKNICADMFLHDDLGCGGFEQDILVRRLTEKWWNTSIKSSDLNDEAERYLQRNLLDEALKCCNQSLEQG